MGVGVGSSDEGELILGSAALSRISRSVLGRMIRAAIRVVTMKRRGREARRVVLVSDIELIVANWKKGKAIRGGWLVVKGFQGLMW